MTTIQAVMTAMAAVMLFLYSLRGFSRELQTAGGAALERWLLRLTRRRLFGFLLGAGATAVLQSSSAVTSLAVVLVDAGVLPFASSLAILLGAHVGTTATAWLVSFKLTGMGPTVMVAGALASFLPSRWRVIGQALFYFGLIFFSLDLMSGTLSPLSRHDVFMRWIGYADHPLVGALFGMVLTAAVQSSSVTTGLAVLLVQEGILPSAAAIPVVIGANVGTTSTALLASLSLSQVARATAMANLIFSAVGVALFLPILSPFSRAMVTTFGDTDTAVAWAHLIFNVTVAGLFLAFLGWIGPSLARRLGVPAAGRGGGGADGTPLAPSAP